ncbi:MAG TPA: hypothetical protein VEJ89_07160 [Myxococcaceae bacterium]|nr:hypothetical protein [Myxococcaceae bacterium]
MTHAAGLGVLALALLPSVAPGASPSKPKAAHVALQFQKRASAKRCPSEKELRREVTAILGYSPFDRRAHKVMACTLSADGDTLHAHLQLRDARTHRSLGVREISASGPGCDELASAVALAIALAVDPLAKPPPPRAPPAASAPPPVSVRAPAPPPPVRTAAPQVSVGAGATGAAVARAEASAVPPAPPAETAAVPLETRLEQPDGGPPPLAAAPVDAGFAPGPDAGALPAAELAAAALPDAGAAPLAAAVEATPDAGPPPVPPAAAERPPEPETTRAPAPGQGGSVRGLVGLGADWTLGLVPSGAFGPVAFGGVDLGIASAELELRWLPTTSLADTGGSIASRLVTAAAVGCALFGDFGACGLIQVGPLTADGRGYTQSLNTTTWVVALGARGQWDWVFAHPVGLRLHVDGLVNLVRPRLLVDGVPAWTAPSVALALGAGLYVVF